MRKTTTLEELRVNNNLSQVEAAKLAGINKQTWNRIETGESKSPRRTTLVKIAKAFNIDVDDIVTREEKAKAEQANKEELISVQSLELVNYTADQIKNETAKNVFLYELAIELQQFFKIDEKRLWVNVNTGSVASDRDFKKRRIDQAITICNNDQTKSIGDELRKMLQYPRWWKHIQLSATANEKRNHPLALLEKAVKGLKLKEDKDKLIEQALQAEQTTESYLDYDNTEYVYDKIYYETDKHFREVALDDALETWYDDRELNVESGYSLYDILEQCNDATDMKTFEQVAEEQSEKGEAYLVPQSFVRGDAYAPYDKWLLKDAKNNGYLTDLVAQRVKFGYDTSEEINHHMRFDGLKWDDLSDILSKLDKDSELHLLYDMFANNMLDRSDFEQFKEEGLIDNADIWFIFDDFTDEMKARWNEQKAEVK